MLSWLQNGEGGIGLPPSKVSDPNDCVSLSNDVYLVTSTGPKDSQSSPLLSE